MRFLRNAILIGVILLLLEGAMGARPTVAAPGATRMLFPLVRSLDGPGCRPVDGEWYDLIPVAQPSPDPAVPVEWHPDINLALRGYRDTASYLGLVEYGGDTDPGAPRLQTMFAGARFPGIASVHQVGEWDGNWPGVYGVYPITSPEVTLIKVFTSPEQVLYVPYRGPEVFHDTLTGQHYVAMVLYATHERLTLVFTRDDHIINGYALHIEGICVDPRLQAAYRTAVAEGRGRLPGLRYGQAIGRSRASTLGLAIRDTGQFLDPRSGKDWWQGVQLTGASLPYIDASNEPWFIERQNRLHGVD